MGRFFVAPSAGLEITAWIHHIEGWTDRQIQNDIQRLRAQIAHTPSQQTRVLENLQFPLDRLLDLQGRRKAERRTLRTSWLAKLRPPTVRQIRQRYAQGWSQERLAQHYRVSQPTIHNLLAGKTYKKVR